jgi:nitrogen fixation protein FixH
MSCCGVFVMPAELTEGDVQAPAEMRAAKPPFAFKGRHALMLFIGFFAIVGAVMTVAIRTMPGLDARNGYDVSQQYNARIAAAAAQDKRGWTTDARVMLVNGQASIVLDLRSRDGDALDHLRPTATLRHPTDRNRDSGQRLTGTGRGGYAGQVPDITPGAWDLVIEVRSEDGETMLFASRQRVILKG